MRTCKEKKSPLKQCKNEPLRFLVSRLRNVPCLHLAAGRQLLETNVIQLKVIIQVYNSGPDS